MSRPVSVTLSHSLGKDEVRRRIRDGVDQLGGSIAGKMTVKVDETWETWETEDRVTFKAKAMGMTVHGSIDIFPEHVRIEAVLPAFLAAAAERITGSIEKQGTLLLEKK